MAEIKLIAIDEILTTSQLRRLKEKLEKLGVSSFRDSIDDYPDLSSATIDDLIGDDSLTDFNDRLEAHDISCTVYLPLAFEGRIVIDDQVIGSAHVLAEVLEDVREELDIDNDEMDPEDQESEFDIIDGQLTHAWQMFWRASNESIEYRIPIQVIA